MDLWYPCIKVVVFLDDKKRGRLYKPWIATVVPYGLTDARFIGILVCILVVEDVLVSNIHTVWSEWNEAHWPLGIMFSRACFASDGNSFVKEVYYGLESTWFCQKKTKGKQTGMARFFSLGTVVYYSSSPVPQVKAVCIPLF